MTLAKETFCVDFYTTIDPDGQRNFAENHMMILFLLRSSICCDHSSELPLWGSSNEWPQHMLNEENKNITEFSETPLPWALYITTLTSLSVLLCPDCLCVWVAILPGWDRTLATIWLTAVLERWKIQQMPVKEEKKFFEYSYHTCWTWGLYFMKQ